MSDGVQTSSDPVLGRARVPPVPGQDGFRKPKHGQGLIRPFQPGNKMSVGNKGGKYNETVALARSHSIAAVQTLAARLHDPDGRIAVVAANSLLERAWGKVKEAKPEDNVVAQIDLSNLSAEELAIMVRLVQSGRLKAAPEADAPPPTIEGDASEKP